MSDKFIKEIEEILKQAEAGPPGQRPKQQRSRRRPRSPFPLGLFRGRIISPGKLMLAGVMLFMAALVLRAFMPSTVGPLVWAGLALFVLAYVLFFVRPGSSGGEVEKRWRGRPVDDSSPSTWDRVKRWFTR